MPIFTPNFKAQQADAEEELNFGGVSIGMGSRISLAKNKSMTSMDTASGGKVRMFSDQLGEIGVTGSNINASLRNFYSTNYVGDPLLASLGMIELPSINDISGRSSWYPSVNHDYWLSDTSNKESLYWRAYANSNNALSSNSLKVKGSIDGKHYDEMTVAKGPYAWSKDVDLKYFIAGENSGQWDLSSDEKSTYLNVYRTDKSWFSNGTTVYNNLEMKDSGYDWTGKPYASTKVQNLDKGSDCKLFGYVRGNYIYQAQPGDKIDKGTICVFAFVKSMHELQNSKYFAGSDIAWTGFMYAQQSFKVKKQYVDSMPVAGLSKLNASAKLVRGRDIQSASLAIRPVMTLNTTNIAFFRDAESSGAQVSETLGSMPTQNPKYQTSVKCVVKDSNLSVSPSFTAANFTADNGKTRIDGTTVHIPYGAKTLTINNINKSGGNYISALSSTDGAKKYGVVGNSNTIKIDLTNLVAVNVLRSEATVSLFAEQINGASTTDVISSKPFTFKIKVTEGVPYKVTYDLDGGSGVTIPKSFDVNSGTSISLADGTFLRKNNNAFSRWLVTYKLPEEDQQTKILMNSMQFFIMPYAEVTVTALYQNISAGKESSTIGKEKFILTLDANGGKWKDGQSSIWVPFEPGKVVGDLGKPIKDGYIFDGWYTKPEGGELADLEKDAFSGHTTLYAHWDWDRVVFLAPKGTDPTKVISGESKVKIIPLTEVKTAARTLATGGKNPDSDTYNSINDAYHLFAKISGDGSNANEWLECRIIHTGQHDGDGSGLTFQAVHALPSRYQWDTKWSLQTRVPNWANCTVRSTMNDSIFSSLPSWLQNAILPVAKKYNTTAGSNPNGGGSATVTDKLWLISTTELVSNVVGKQPYWSDNSHQGSTYAFWNSKNLMFAESQDSDEKKRLLYAMICNRAGTLLKDSSWEFGYARVRSVSPRFADCDLQFNSYGIVSHVGGWRKPSDFCCVSPCFAM